jgi:hypothetical protein
MVDSSLWWVSTTFRMVDSSLWWVSTTFHDFYDFHDFCLPRWAGSEDVEGVCLFPSVDVHKFFHKFTHKFIGVQAYWGALRFARLLPDLIRISRQPSAAAVQTRMSAALCPVGFHDVL